jgi:hypothetical protein
MLINILRKSLKIISLFPHNLGVQRCPLFVLGASQDALLAKGLLPLNGSTKVALHPTVPYFILF